jgi:hypothetical protein
MRPAFVDSAFGNVIESTPFPYERLARRASAAGGRHGADRVAAILTPDAVPGELKPLVPAASAGGGLFPRLLDLAVQEQDGYQQGAVTLALRVLSQESDRAVALLLPQPGAYRLLLQPAIGLHTLGFLEGARHDGDRLVGSAVSVVLLCDELDQSVIAVSVK